MRRSCASQYGPRPEELQHDRVSQLSPSTGKAHSPGRRDSHGRGASANSMQGSGGSGLLHTAEIGRSLRMASLIA